MKFYGYDVALQKAASIFNKAKCPLTSRNVTDDTSYHKARQLPSCNVADDVGLLKLILPDFWKIDKKINKKMNKKKEKKETKKIWNTFKVGEHMYIQHTDNIITVVALVL